MTKLSAPFSAFIFDMDGVLLDSENIYKQASIEVAHELGFKMSEEIYLKTVGVTDDIAGNIIRAGMGANFPFDEFEKNWQIWVSQKMAQNIPLKQGVKDILDLLKLSNFPLAIATSTSYKRAHEYLSNSNLIDYFNIIITGDDITNGKPHPEPFLKAATRLGIKPSQCVAIEDSFNGVRSAHSAGMQVIMIPDQLAPNKEMKKLCHAILPSLYHLNEACDL